MDGAHHPRASLEVVVVVVDVWMVVTVVEERGEEEEAKERTTERWVYWSKKFPQMPGLHS